jgi:hypothetical protein
MEQAMTAHKRNNDRQNDRELSLDDLESVSGGKPANNTQAPMKYLEFKLKDALITSTQ